LGLSAFLSSTHGWPLSQGIHRMGHSILFNAPHMEAEPADTQTFGNTMMVLAIKMIKWNAGIA
jgi:hypothetical protein